MKLRFKIIFLLIVLVLTSVLSALYGITNKFYGDKLDSIYEKHTFAALNISQQVQAYISKLKLLNEQTPNIKISDYFPELAHIIEIKNGKIQHSFMRDTELASTLYGSILEKSYRTIFSVGNFICFSFFQDEINTVYMVDAAFIKSFSQREQAVGIGIFDIQDFKVINLGDPHFQFVAPDRASLDQLGKSNNIFAKIIKLSEGKMLIALAPIDKEHQSFVLVQAMQGQITDLVFSALNNILAVILGLILIFILIGIVGTQNILKPIELLTDATKRISKGEWDINLDMKRNDEIGKLGKSFNQMGIELKNREGQIHEMNEKLLQNERLASLGMFSAGVAHEVKNPLGAILGNAQLIKRVNSENEKIEKYSEVIIRESYRANNIVQDLLTFAKERPLNLEQVSIEDFSKRLEGILSPRCVENKIQLIQNVQVNTWGFDLDQMIQALDNIGSNAIDALIEANNQDRQLKIEYKKTDGDLHIIISDNGIGIDKEALKRIFEPFFSTKKINKGTGLGMAICFGIIKKHNGDIEVQSTKGEGTRFDIRISS